MPVNKYLASFENQLTKVWKEWITDIYNRWLERIKKYKGSKNNLQSIEDFKSAYNTVFNKPTLKTPPKQVVTEKKDITPPKPIKPLRNDLMSKESIKEVKPPVLKTNKVKQYKTIDSKVLNAFEDYFDITNNSNIDVNTATRKLESALVKKWYNLEEIKNAYKPYVDNYNETNKSSNDYLLMLSQNKKIKGQSFLEKRSAEFQVANAEYKSIAYLPNDSQMIANSNITSDQLATLSKIYPIEKIQDINKYIIENNIKEKKNLNNLVNNDLVISTNLIADNLWLNTWLTLQNKTLESKNIYTSITKEYLDLEKEKEWLYEKLKKEHPGANSWLLNAMVRRSTQEIDRKLNSKKEALIVAKWLYDINYWEFKTMSNIDHNKATNRINIFKELQRTFNQNQKALSTRELAKYRSELQIIQAQEINKLSNNKIHKVLMRGSKAVWITYWGEQIDLWEWYSSKSQLLNKWRNVIQREDWWNTVETIDKEWVFTQKHFNKQWIQLYKSNYLSYYSNNWEVVIPTSFGWGNNKWVDIDWKKWEPIYSFQKWYVYDKWYDKDWYGNWIKIKTKIGWTIQYSHLNKESILDIWTEVDAGSIIWAIGNTWNVLDINWNKPTLEQLKGETWTHIDIVSWDKDGKIRDWVETYKYLSGKKTDFSVWDIKKALSEVPATLKNAVEELKAYEKVAEEKLIEYDWDEGLALLAVAWWEIKEWSQAKKDYLNSLIGLNETSSKFKYAFISNNLQKEWENKYKAYRSFENQILKNNLEEEEDNFSSYNTTRLIVTKINNIRRQFNELRKTKQLWVTWILDSIKNNTVKAVLGDWDYTSLISNVEFLISWIRKNNFWATLTDNELEVFKSIAPSTQDTEEGFYAKLDWLSNNVLKTHNNNRNTLWIKEFNNESEIIKYNNYIDRIESEFWASGNTVVSTDNRDIDLQWRWTKKEILINKKLNDDLFTNIDLINNRINVDKQDTLENNTIKDFLIASWVWTITDIATIPALLVDLKTSGNKLFTNIGKDLFNKILPISKQKIDSSETYWEVFEFKALDYIDKIQRSTEELFWGDPDSDATFWGEIFTPTTILAWGWVIKSIWKWLIALKSKMSDWVLAFNKIAQWLDNVKFKKDINYLKANPKATLEQLKQNVNILNIEKNIKWKIWKQEEEYFNAVNSFNVKLLSDLWNKKAAAEAVKYSSYDSAVDIINKLSIKAKGRIDDLSDELRLTWKWYDKYKTIDSNLDAKDIGVLYDTIYWDIKNISAVTNKFKNTILREIKGEFHNIMKNNKTNKIPFSSFMQLKRWIRNTRSVDWADSASNNFVVDKFSDALESIIITQFKWIKEVDKQYSKLVNLSKELKPLLLNKQWNELKWFASKLYWLDKPNKKVELNLYSQLLNISQADLKKQVTLLNKNKDKLTVSKSNINTINRDVSKVEWNNIFKELKQISDKNNIINKQLENNIKKKASSDLLGYVWRSDSGESFSNNLKKILDDRIKPWKWWENARKAYKDLTSLISDKDIQILKIENALSILWTSEWKTRLFYSKIWAASEWWKLLIRLFSTPKKIIKQILEKEISIWNKLKRWEVLNETELNKLIKLSQIITWANILIPNNNN